MSVKDLTFTIHTEVLCEYEGNIVLAIFINGKFSSVVTVNEEGLD